MRWPPRGRPQSRPDVGRNPLNRAQHVGPSLASLEYEPVVRVLNGEAAPLAEPVPGMADKPRLRIAVVIPAKVEFGSGGHDVLFQIFSRLERAGHVCSYWLDDPFRMHAKDAASVVRRAIIDNFRPIEGPLFKGFDEWYGADVVVATGWQTVYPAMLLEQCRARVYMVNDHEPEFYPTSLETFFSAQTYRLGLHCIGASPWMRDLLRERYGATAGVFHYGVGDAYRPRPVQRRRDTVVLYARTVTGRRAVGLGVLALAELRRRMPDVRIVMFGDRHPLPASFSYDHLGIVQPDELSWLYSEATVGIAFSMTNCSLVPQDMMACGLPCVELKGYGAASVYGEDGPVELVPFDHIGVADAVERLLTDEERWNRRSQAGLQYLAEHTWDGAAREVEAELRTALRAREAAAFLA
jgi:glycosyltransferase involved in cell wall biosynthesis